MSMPPRLRALAGIVAAALVGACVSPFPHKISQLYYLGVFDPDGQVPPSLYRLKVVGVAPGFSDVNYAAGWVPAPFVDSLGGVLSFDSDAGSLSFDQGDGPAGSVQLQTGKRLMLFGPEGFREAPADHRLAIVMASDPSEFFEAIDTAVGELSAAKAIEAQSSAAVGGRIAELVLAAREEQLALARFQLDSTGEGEE